MIISEPCPVWGLPNPHPCWCRGPETWCGKEVWVLEMVMIYVLEDGRDYREGGVGGTLCKRQSSIPRNTPGRWGLPRLSLLGLGPEEKLSEWDGSSMLAILLSPLEWALPKHKGCDRGSQHTFSLWAFHVHESIVRHWLVGLFCYCFLVRPTSS